MERTSRLRELKESKVMQVPECEHCHVKAKFPVPYSTARLAGAGTRLLHDYNNAARPSRSPPIVQTGIPPNTSRMYRNRGSRGRHSRAWFVRYRKPEANTLPACEIDAHGPRFEAVQCMLSRAPFLHRGAVCALAHGVIARSG